MRFRLTPQKSSFYDLFAEAGGNLVEGANVLAELIAARSHDRPTLAKKLRDIEHDADEVTHRILNEVNGTFVTPFDREDIYRLASRLDDVVDFMEASGDLIVLYQVDAIPDELVAIADTLVRAAYLAREALGRLRTPGELNEYFVEANKLENDADKVYRRFLAHLFSGEFKTLTVLKLKDIGDQLEAAADAFESVANQVETIAVKDS